MKKILVSAVCLGMLSCSTVDAGFLDKIRSSKFVQFAQNVKQKAENSRIGQKLKYSKVGQALKNAVSIKFNQKMNSLFGKLRTKVSSLVTEIGAKSPTAAQTSAVNAAATNINNELNGFNQNEPLAVTEGRLSRVETNLNTIDRVAGELNVPTNGVATIVTELRSIFTAMVSAIVEAEKANQEVVAAINNSLDLTAAEKTALLSLTTSVSNSLNTMKTTTDPKTFAEAVANLKNTVSTLKAKIQTINKNNQLYQTMNTLIPTLEGVVNRRIKQSLTEVINRADETAASMLTDKLAGDSANE